MDLPDVRLMAVDSAKKTSPPPRSKKSTNSTKTKSTSVSQDVPPSNLDLGAVVRSFRFWVLLSIALVLTLNVVLYIYVINQSLGRDDSTIPVRDFMGGVIIPKYRDLNYSQIENQLKLGHLPARIEERLRLLYMQNITDRSIHTMLSNLSIDLHPTCVHYFNHANRNIPESQLGCIPHACEHKPSPSYETFLSSYPKNKIRSYRGVMLRDIDRAFYRRAMQKSTQCYVSRKYEFVYAHTLKAGGTSMRGFLRHGLCKTDDLKKCNPELLVTSKCRIAADKYAHFFWFSAVRNPFDRAFSLYSHSMQAGKLSHGMSNDKGRLGRETFAHCVQSASNWGTHERNLALHKLHKKSSEGFNHLRPLPQALLQVTFNSTYHINNEDIRGAGRDARDATDADAFARQDFILQNLNYDASNAPQKRASSYPCPRVKAKQGVTAVHYNDQNAFIFDPNYCPNVDYVANLETINEDLEFLLFIINSPELNEYYIRNGEFWNVNVFGGSLKSKIIKFEKGEYELDANANMVLPEDLESSDLKDVYREIATNVTQNKVVEWFLADFLLFGYNMTHIDDNRILYQT